jgi:hypothetical protein
VRNDARGLDRETEASGKVPGLQNVKGGTIFGAVRRQQNSLPGPGVTSAGAFSLVRHDSCAFAHARRVDQALDRRYDDPAAPGTKSHCLQFPLTDQSPEQRVANAPK